MKKGVDKKAVYWAMGILVIIVLITLILYFQQNIQLEETGWCSINWPLFEGKPPYYDFDSTRGQPIEDDEIRNALFPNEEDKKAAEQYNHDDLMKELKKRCEYAEDNRDLCETNGPKIIRAYKNYNLCLFHPTKPSSSIPSPKTAKKDATPPTKPSRGGIKVIDVQIYIAPKR